MKSYIAHDKCSGAVYGGGRTACLHWAFEHVKQSPRSAVNILIVRHKAPARIIAEVAAEGGFWVFFWWSHGIKLANSANCGGERPMGVYKQEGHYLRLYDSLINSAAYRDLSSQAKCLLVEFARIYRPNRNGDLSISTRQAMKLIRISDVTAGRIFYELAAHGFIKQTLCESWTHGKARSFQITWEPSNGREPTNEWLHWEPGANLCPLPMKSAHKNKSSTLKEGARLPIKIGQTAPN